MDEGRKRAFSTNSGRNWNLEFHGARIRSDSGYLSFDELDKIFRWEADIEAIIGDSGGQAIWQFNRWGNGELSGEESWRIEFQSSNVLKMGSIPHPPGPIL